MFKDKKQTRNLFKRIYKCHRKTKTNVAEAKKKTRNLNCPAELINTIKKFIPGSKSTISDPLLPDWPCVIQFKNSHNHRLLCVDNLSDRPLGLEAKKNILQLFEKGHSVSSAYHTFCINMMEELGNEYENQLLDRHNIPTKTDVQTLWRKHFKDNYGPRTGEGMLIQLENCLKVALKANNTLYKINCHEGDYCVAICTPIMQRGETCHKLLKLCLWMRLETAMCKTIKFISF